MKTILKSTIIATIAISYFLIRFAGAPQKIEFLLDGMNIVDLLGNTFNPDSIGEGAITPWLSKGSITQNMHLDATHYTFVNSNISLY